MNVWAVKKDNAIRRLLLALVEVYGSDSFVMSGRWEKDENAVGLYQPGEESILAYVFTYGQESGRYGLHFEYPDLNDSSVSTMMENLDIKHLIELLKAHFDLEPRHV